MERAGWEQWLRSLCHLGPFLPEQDRACKHKKFKCFSISTQSTHSLHCGAGNKNHKYLDAWSHLSWKTAKCRRHPSRHPSTVHRSCHPTRHYPRGTAGIAAGIPLLHLSRQETSLHGRQTSLHSSSSAHCSRNHNRVVLCCF